MSFLRKLALFVGCLVTWGSPALAGSWDDSKCSQQCNGATGIQRAPKFEYSEGTAYIYKYEASNKLLAERTSDLFSQLKATVKITSLSKCEMVLEVSDAQSSSPSLAAKLERHPLPFSFSDGKIDHVCPDPEDSDEVNNVKKAILSSLQNTMPHFEMSAFNTDTDVLGTCDTTYKSRERGGKYIITKIKHIPSCSNHLKGQTLLLATPYESGANRQHLPFLSDEEASCKQVIHDGITEEVECNETATFGPLGNYGYVVTAIGWSKLTKVASEPAAPLAYKAPKPSSLAFQYDARVQKSPHAETEAREILRHICDNTKDSIKKEAASYVHKLVYTIRRMDSQAVENVYTALKNNQICSSKKPQSIYLDALRMASSGGSVALLTKLTRSGELSELRSALWMTLLPFTSYVEEESIASALPLLEKGTSTRQTLLGITALAYKFCSVHPDCESTQAIKDLSSRLKSFLGNHCGSGDDEEEREILTALKAFGNLGYVGDSADALFDCASAATNPMTLRMAAIDSFRRSPCKHEIVSKLLDIYGNKAEHDELRMGALVTLSKCGSVEIANKIVEIYSAETSNQVQVFTWTFLENIRTSSDPAKVRFAKFLAFADLEKPESTDITKFSRNFELSFFSEIFNLGIAREANVLRSKDSYLPKSASLAYKLNLFGNGLEPLEFGARAEDFEHIFEKLFGPTGVITKDIENLLPAFLRRSKRSPESYEAKVDALHERFGYKRDAIPHGNAFVRVMGHEIGLLHLSRDTVTRAVSKVRDLLKNLPTLKDLADTSKNLLFVDVSVVFPSITGAAYKLSTNGSITVGIKSDGKFDLKHKFPVPSVDIDGKFQPSILGEVTASFTIHHSDFEPGVRVETVLNAALDIKAKVELKDNLVHVKLGREKKRSEIFHLKRTLYYMNKNGEFEMEKPPSHHLEYCTKYLQALTGAKYCASLTFPHAFKDGSFKIPFVRELEASVVVEQTDDSMEGYEFLFELPDLKSPEKRFRILVDTPNSAVDRKLALELDFKHPDDTTCQFKMNLHTPFYTLDGNGHVVDRDDQFRLSADVTGNGKRRYSLNVEAVKVVKGARLVEYQPKITLRSPFTTPVEVTGTLVFSKGRKSNLAVNLESKSFSSPFSLKGNLAKEGEAIDLSSDWKLSYEMNANMFSQVHRVRRIIGYTVNKGLYIDIGHHYEPDGRSYESIDFEGKIENIKIFGRLGFNLDSKILFAEHEDLNSMLKWDFSLKPLHHFKNDILFRYGKNFEDNEHLVRSTIVSSLHGDFDSFQKLTIENKLGLTISCLNFDKSASLSAVWDFIDDPKFLIDVGVKSGKDKEVKLNFDYRHIQKNPLVLASDFLLGINHYKFKYRDEAHEVAPNEYKWNSTIEPYTLGKAITTDFMYYIKSKGEDFHHEMDGTIKFPAVPDPISHKGLLKISEGRLKFNSHTNFGRGNVYVIELELERNGKNELKLNTPFVEGNLVVDASSSVRSVRADLRSKGAHNQRIVLSGKVTPGDTTTLDLEVQWDADRDPQKKVTSQLTFTTETVDGIDNYVIGGTVNYGNTIDLSCTISTNLIRGPHFFRAEFAGNMEPMAVEIEHEIKDRQLNSVIKYLRSGVEKIRADIKGKLVLRGYSHLEIEGGIFTSSPYKTFDGKSLSFRLMGDSTDNANTLVAEYGLKLNPALGYEGKFNYQRKRGWPGNIRSNLYVKVHGRTLYEGNGDVDYGNGKYSVKISFTPISKKKFNFLTSLEHSARFAVFQHSLATSFQYLQNVDVSVVADFRNMEDAKVVQSIDVNSNKLYDVLGTIKMRSILDFDAEATIFSKITPSLKVFSKAQTSGSVTKYDFNLNIDSKDVVTGSGEFKKRKKGFNGDVAFKYGEKEILSVNVKEDSKGKNERNYVIKLKFPARLYTANIKINKEKEAVHYETKFCRNELCVNVDATHKEYGNTNEWQITYRRDDVEFSIERIRESSPDVERFHTVIYKGDKRYGYDVRFFRGNKLSLGLVLPSRKIIVAAAVEFSLQKPRLVLELSTDGERHPDRKLIADIRLQNHLGDSDPSVLDLTITHPIFEKPINIQLSGDYEPLSAKYFTASGTLDYSNDPEDKLIGKLTVEDLPGGTTVMQLNIYHKDDKHLDFVIRFNTTMNSKEASSALLYQWKDEGGNDKEAYVISNYLKSEKRYVFKYERPRLSYSLEGKIHPPATLLDNTQEIDLESTYNGNIAKGKLFADYSTGCFKLSVLREGGETTRTVDLCINLSSRKFLSVTIESFDSEEYVFEYELDVFLKDMNTIGILQQVNPDFLGAIIFQGTNLMNELDEAGVGTLPFHDSPRFKKIRTSFDSKVLSPAQNFIVPEAQKFVTDVAKDVVYFHNVCLQTIARYYSKLPSLEVVKEKVQAARLFIRSIAYEIAMNFYPYYEHYIEKILHYANQVRDFVVERCDKSEECKRLVHSYESGGWRNLLVALKDLFLRLPDVIQECLENPNSEFRNLLKRAFETLKHYLEPLTRCKCGEIVVKVVQLSYAGLKPRAQYFMDNLPHYYRNLRQKIRDNEYYKLSIGLLKTGCASIQEAIRSIDYKELSKAARKYFEEYVLTLSPPTKNVITVYALGGEKGTVDMDINVNVVNKLGKRIGKIVRILAMKSAKAGLNYNQVINSLFVKLKRALDLGFIPPYDGQAMILGNRHFRTFDSLFFDFAGECGYLLARDFQDGNFTLALKPRDDGTPSILVFRGGSTVELASGETSVKAGDAAVDLPYSTKDLSVIREGNTISVDTKTGFKVTCNIFHEICIFDMSGFYYGKTAGLLGTYNYEENDDFKRPKGHVANSVTVFAKSWELKKGCKTTNLVPEPKINTDSAYYALCKTHFKSEASSLAACFEEVPPENYFQLCLRHLASAKSDQKKALCSVATAYVTECEKNYVTLSLPEKCLTCDAPDGSKLVHGDRKKFENLKKKSAHTVFLVEDHECNKVLVSDLGNLARSVEKEMGNEGYANSFSVIGFGGDIGDPEIFTAKDKIIFTSRDINSISGRFKLESKKSEGYRAFEAIKHGVTHLFQSDSAKSFVLLLCSACKYDFTSLQYPVVQEILLERGISLHVIKDTEIPIRKSSAKEKNIIGVDPDTVFHTTDVTERDLVGEPNLRSQVIMPKDLCIALSQDVNGSFFSTSALGKSSSGEVKNWRSVFARKFLKSTQSFACQWCDCTSTRDHLPNTVCQPCEMKRPRLPFSVGSSNAYTRTLETFLSYILHLIRE